MSPLTLREALAELADAAIKVIDIVSSASDELLLELLGPALWKLTGKISEARLALTAPEAAATPSDAQIVSVDVDSPGIYRSVNLNGFALISHSRPPEHERVILGYRVPFLPEVWFGVGYRRSCRIGREVLDSYWLGPTGLDPHYQQLAADQIIMWRPVEWPFAFDQDREETNSYLQYHYIVGEGSWETEEASKRARQQSAALAAASAQPAAQVLASSDPEAHRQAIVDSEADRAGAPAKPAAQAPAMPAEAEELAKRAVEQYLIACRMTDQAQIGNYLMKLCSVAGVVMAQAEGSVQAYERLIGTAAFIVKTMPERPAKLHKVH